MTRTELSSIESDIAAQGYKLVVKVDAAGKTVVTLTHRVTGNSFAGQSTGRGVSDRRSAPRRSPWRRR